MRRWDLSSKPGPFVPSKLDTCILEMATSKLPISTLSKYRYHCQGNILWFSHLRGQCSSWPCRGRSRPCTSSCQSLWSWPCECAKSRFPTSSGKVACPSRVASSVCDTKKSEKKIQRRSFLMFIFGKSNFLPPPPAWHELCKWARLQFVRLAGTNFVRFQSREGLKKKWIKIQNQS